MDKLIDIEEVNKWFLVFDYWIKRGIPKKLKDYTPKPKKIRPTLEEQKARKRSISKAYYHNNKDKALEYQKRYRQIDIQNNKKKFREYYCKRKDAILEKEKVRRIKIKLRRQGWEI